MDGSEGGCTIKTRSLHRVVDTASRIAPREAPAATPGRYIFGVVIAYHVILSAYGFWLPNDPRGSWSTEVWAAHLRPFGPATKVMTHHSLAGAPHDRDLRLAAKEALLYPAVRFDGLQARAIGMGFAKIAAKMGFVIHACAIMPDHAHLVIARHEMLIEDIAGYLKRAATRELNAQGIHPLREFVDGRGRTPSPWAEDGWYVFLDIHDDVASRIRYVERNPEKAGLPPQRWLCVTTYGA
jgi:REP element-mobilizing transposase RayT